MAIELQLSTSRAVSQLAAAEAAIDRLKAKMGSAAGSTNKFSAALAGVRAPSGLGPAASQFGQVGNAANKASAGVRNFGGAMGTVTGLMAGFGVAVGAVGFSQFVTGSVRALRTTEQFHTTLSTFKDQGLDTGEMMKVVSKRANDLGLSVQNSLDAYRKFGTAAISAGQSLETTNKTFENFQTVAGALKLSGDQVSRVFLALEQTFSKGKVSSEELRRQLGEVIPGAYQEMANALGMSGAELDAALRAGQIPAEAMVALGERLATKYRDASVAAGATFVAALERLKNGLFATNEAFGRAFGEASKGAINALAEAMNSEGFKAAAATFGTIVGTFTSLVTNVITLAAQFPILSGAVTGTLAVFFTMRMVIGIFFGITGAVVGAGAAVKTFSAGALALSAVQGVVTAVGGAFRLLAAASALPLVPIIAITVGVLALGVGLGALIGYLTGAYTVEEMFAAVTTTASNAVNSLFGGVGQLGGELSSTAKASKDTADGIGETGKQATQAEINLARMQKEAALAYGELIKTRTAAAQAGEGMGQAATASGELASGVGSAAGAASGSVSSFSAATAAVETLGDAYRNTAAAARELAAAQGGGGGGGGSVNVPSGAGGGVGANLLGGTQRVPLSAFTNAPAFAGGTPNTNNLGAPSLPGGGFPAVLHGNEAVVPLTGGGAIPIAGVGGGAGGGQSMAGLAVLREIDTELSRITGMTNTANNLYVEMTRKTHDLLAMLKDEMMRVGGNVLEGSNRIVTAVNQIKLSGGGSGGSGGSYSGGSGGGGSAGDFASAFKSANDKLASVEEQQRSSNFQKWRFGTGNWNFVNPEDRKASAAMAREADAAAAEQRAILEQVGVTFNKTGQADYSRIDKDFLNSLDPYTRKQFDKKMNSNGTGLGSFADGTPDTSRYSRGAMNVDGKGGFLSILHPNEAVIPLDKGGNVPISISGGNGTGPSRPPSTVPTDNSPRFDEVMMRQQRKMQRGSGAFSNNSTSTGATGGGSGSAPVIVHMHIKTPDAESFARNRDQIVQDLQSRLSRTQKQFGEKQIVDDPTAALIRKGR